jgi:hypothetical protein
MSFLQQILYALANLPEVTLEPNGHSFNVCYQGKKFDGSALTLEEALMQGYLWAATEKRFMEHPQASELRRRAGGGYGK